MNPLALVLGYWVIVNVLLVGFGWLFFHAIPSGVRWLRARVGTVVLLRDLERARR